MPYARFETVFMIWTVLDTASIVPDRHYLLTICYLNELINDGSRAGGSPKENVAIMLRIIIALYLNKILFIQNIFSINVFHLSPQHMLQLLHVNATVWPAPAAAIRPCNNTSRHFENALSAEEIQQLKAMGREDKEVSKNTAAIKRSG